jgi:hypothetical protein
LQDTRLIKILKTFTSAEFKNFGKFLASPFFSSGRDLIPLYKAIRKFHPGFDAAGLEKETIFAKLGKGKYNDQLMRIIISDMYKASVEYLKYLAVSSDHVRANIQLSDEAIARGLFFLAAQGIDDAEKLVNSDSITDSYFVDKFDIENAKTDYNFFSGDVRYKGSIEKNASDYHMINFLMLASNHLHNMYSIKTNINTEYSGYALVKFLKKAQLELLEPELAGSKDMDAARIYLYYILSHMDENDEHYFYKLKDLLFRNLQLFAFSERRFLLVIYDSLCTKKIFDVDFERYTNERLEAKKKMLDEGMFARDGHNYIGPVRFYSFIMAGISAGDYKWTEMMLDKHAGDVAPEHRASLLNYFKAEICCLKNDFEGALTYTGKVDLSAFFMQPTLYALQLKIFYELNHVDEALSIIDTYRHYIANNKQASVIVRNARADFLKYYHKLLMYKNGKRLYTPARLKRELADSPSLHKNWLIEKLEEWE